MIFTTKQWEFIVEQRRHLFGDESELFIEILRVRWSETENISVHLTIFQRTLSLWGAVEANLARLFILRRKLQNCEWDLWIEAASDAKVQSPVYLRSAVIIVTKLFYIYLYPIINCETKCTVRSVYFIIETALPYIARLGSISHLLNTQVLYTT